MSHAGRFALPTLLLAGMLATPAQADIAPLTPERQLGLDAAMRDWTLGPFGGGASVQPYTQSVEGDHYRLDEPFRFGSAETAIIPVVIDAKPLDGGRWALDSVPLSNLVTNAPVPTSSFPNDRLTFGLRNFVSHSIVDPSLAATSSFDSAGAGMALGFAAPMVEATAIATGKFAAHSLWRPAGPGRVDATTSQDADEVVAQTSGSTGGRLTVRHITEQHHIRLLAPAKQTAAILLLALGTPKRSFPATSDGRLSDTQRAQLHGAVDALRDASDGIEGAIGLQGIGVQVTGLDFSLDKCAFGYSVGSAAGKADVKLRMALGSLGSASLPLSKLLPRHVVLALHLTGAPVADLFDAAAAAIDQDDAQPATVVPSFMAVLSQLPLTIGLDQLSFDTGPANWTASGTLRGSGPQNLAGDVLVRATGLDALIRLAAADPQLRGLAPKLILLKGVGRQDGDAVTWKLVRSGNGVTVNGTDLSQLTRRHA